MTVILKSDYIVPEPYSLDMRGIQTDAYNEVMGGHKALIDPLQSGLGSVANGANVPNLISGGEPAVASAAFADIDTNKGFVFAGTNKSIALPAAFNLLSFGSEPSVLISLWATRAEAAMASAYIAGSSYQVTTGVQWSLSEHSSGQLSFRVGGIETNVGDVTDVGNPLLFTALLRRTTPGNYRVSIYRGTELRGEFDRTYPFPNPADLSGAWPGPKLGNASGTGYSENVTGAIHRAQTAKVNPDTFDAAEWIAAELAGNNGRFVIE